jgi:DNA-binding HxlR family transcriptional regulator
MRQQRKTSGCPTGWITLAGKCQIHIVASLLSGTKRFGELQRLMPWTTRQTLTVQLRELERRGVLHRHVYLQMPPKVEYSLTERGRNLEPMLRQMRTWKEEFCEQMGFEH